MNVTKPKPSSELVLTTLLSGSLTCVLSIIYVVLCIVALIFRADCEAGLAYKLTGSDHLIATVFRVYFQDGTCPGAVSMEKITSDYSVFVLVTITLAASVLSLIAAIVLITAVLSKAVHKYMSICAYGYIGVCIASFVIDLTFGVHFGIDYSYLSDLLNNFSPGIGFNYDIDVLRIGAFLLMVLALKGFISHVINLALLVLLIIYLIDYAKSLDRFEHSIHKVGVIQAFDTNKNQRDSVLQRCETCQMNAVLASNGGSQINYGYMNDDDPPRSLTRENSRREDFSTPVFDRSFSWQQAPSTAPRPFSYLEEARRQAPPRAPSSPASENQWRRNAWQGATPPVPAPDYSPQAPRRLKSALKPAYM